MCSFDPLRMLTSTLNDVPVHRGEVRLAGVSGPTGQQKVLTSSSGVTYELAEKVDDVQKGQGEIRKVFVIENGEVNKDNALVAKIYPICRLEPRKCGDDFIREIKIHAMVSKAAKDANIAGIVPVQEVILTADHLLLIMPYYNKRDLFYFLTNRAELLPVEEAKTVFRRVVQAVSFLHDLNLFHRDISCENLYCHVQDPNHRVKSVSLSQMKVDNEEDVQASKRAKCAEQAVLDLGDFGMSAPCSQAAAMNLAHGKPSYRAPEVIAGLTPARDVNWQACDMWALGIVLHVLLMQSFPFGAAKETDRAFQDRIMDKKLVERSRQELARSCYNRQGGETEMRERLAGIALVQRLLTVKPADRPTAKEILADAWLAPPAPVAVFNRELDVAQCVNQVASPVSVCRAMLTLSPCTAAPVVLSTSFSTPSSDHSSLSTMAAVSMAMETSSTEEDEAVEDVRQQGPGRPPPSATTLTPTMTPMACNESPDAA